MEIPYIVIDQLTPSQQQVWNTYFGDADRPRYIEEGIWRRTQEEATAGQSGWSGGDDARRRLIHYRYRYDLVPTTAAPAIGLTDLYLYHSVTAPAGEITAHEDALRAALAVGGWKRTPGGALWMRRDLKCKITQFTLHPQDAVARRKLPQNYRSLDVHITSAQYAPPPAVRQRPWDVLASGIRIKDQRGTPTLAPDLSALADYLPFQVEIGCGTSVEAGIPPLHRLHEIYRVTDRQGDDPREHHFALSPTSDPLLHEVLTEPEEKTAEFTEMFKACFLAEPTPAMHALKELHDTGHLVGPVITNNFDVLAARAGLKECFMRRYDQAVPDVEWVDGAKALLVVGLHADRRKVQARARERGLKVVYLDPEGFWHDGQFKPYPLEGPQDDDLVCRKPAAEGLTELVNLLAKATD
ncbi:hypothetical protein AF335_18250 [Streptomyces eurocidicus]|uniref:Uncharacterized protein n=1 Tax=Streptomyces eurocidicus TaxID=66423 RepID=A0A2N8NUQ7_STREU|nr:hypothetical protein [Streptomyces eurocidicus]MBB5121284.1 hypothetical protein [Streptomyces eurocidicus]MBF6055894.1 hypothetical protein [Streptomyces eurocidicus]PNE32510.1 hypothetical protein AF335_18250 [Streptomyces eurocidicus]